MSNEDSESGTHGELSQSPIKRGNSFEQDRFVFVPFNDLGRNPLSSGVTVLRVKFYRNLDPKVRRKPLSNEVSVSSINGDVSIEYSIKS